MEKFVGNLSADSVKIDDWKSYFKCATSFLISYIAFPPQRHAHKKWYERPMMLINDFSHQHIFHGGKREKWAAYTRRACGGISRRELSLLFCVGEEKLRRYSTKTFNIVLVRSVASLKFDKSPFTFLRQWAATSKALAFDYEWCRGRDFLILFSQKDHLITNPMMD